MWIIKDELVVRRGEARVKLCRSSALEQVESGGSCVDLEQADIAVGCGNELFGRERNLGDLGTVEIEDDVRAVRPRGLARAEARSEFFGDGCAISE